VIASALLLRGSAEGVLFLLGSSATKHTPNTYGVGYSGDLAGHESNNASLTRDSGESLNLSGQVCDGGDSSTRSGARRKRGCMMLEDEDPLI
jgi:hypothetical protein